MHSLPSNRFTLVLAIALCTLAACDSGTDTASTSPSPQEGTPAPKDTIPAASTSKSIPWNQSITYGSVVYAGQTYKTVEIGTQNWMAENLNYAGASGTIGACYNHSADSCAKFGRLYAWSEAMGLPDSCNKVKCASLVAAVHQGICPPGWHVPRDAEWSVLVKLAGGESSASSELKSSAGWKPRGSGSDKYGFRALPAGTHDAPFFNVAGGATIWRSATEFDAKNEWHRNIDYMTSQVYRNADEKARGFSVRCVED
jgi:uncharacterized protein (TIGR02145 family)